MGNREKTGELQDIPLPLQNQRWKEKKTKKATLILTKKAISKRRRGSKKTCRDNPIEPKQKVVKLHCVDHKRQTREETKLS